MEKFNLSKDVYVKTVALRVKDIDKMVNFYKNVLGFILKLEENNLSIFGSQEKNSRLLILEETECSQDKLEPFEKKVCLSLLIPTEEEFNSVLRRITAHNYPISYSRQEGDRISVFLEDPEGNELEVSCQSMVTQYVENTEPIDIEALVQQSNVLYSSLSAGARFDRIKVRVENKSEQHSFYQDVLGMSSEDRQKEKLSINNGDFSVYLADAIKRKSQKATGDEGLGIDFFVLTLEQEAEMKHLKEHLEEQQQEFFVDKKLTILTIYDPSNIEWWFVRN